MGKILVRFCMEILGIFPTIFKGRRAERAPALSPGRINNDLSRAQRDAHQDLGMPSHQNPAFPFDSRSKKYKKMPECILHSSIEGLIGLD